MVNQAVEFVVEVRHPGKEPSVFECQDHSLAASLAKRLSREGTKAIVRRKKSVEPKMYSVLLIDIETGEISRTRFLYRKFEAAHFFSTWKISSGAAVLLWPDWKPIPKPLQVVE